MIVYAIDNRKSFESVKKWFENFRFNTQEQGFVPLILVGNKVDLETTRAVR